ncbi:Type I inositol 1,4,5-trisphosphate 5-phosphatase [Ancistrocladus abbreviatus]
MKRATRPRSQLWPRVVLRKLLNIGSRDSDYSADTEDDFDDEDSDDDFAPDVEECQPRLRRRNSETFRAQYINTKEIRICAGTWNVAGKVPTDGLDVEDWLDIGQPSDIYVLGLQEIVPLNAGNIFGAEDSRPVLKWENIIRETLNRVHPAKEKCKCYSDPPSPSKFKPYHAAPDIEDELLLGTDSDDEEEVHPSVEGLNELFEVRDKPISGEETVMDSGVPDRNSTVNQGPANEEHLLSPSLKRLHRSQFFQSGSREDDEEVPTIHSTKLNKTLSGKERIGLSWPEPPLNLLARHVLERPKSLKSKKSFGSSKSFKAYGSFKTTNKENHRAISDIRMLTGLDLESLIQRRRRPEYVRIVSKQMVGIFLTIWVRRRLRKHIKNLKVSTVGVGVMGYIGNKGSVSVSMSIYQTLFCFICTHLTSGDKDGDELKRNSDVHEIHRRTAFHPLSSIGLPKSILDHERIIWLGDLNYRINLSYEKTWELVLRNEWAELIKRDQLVQELKKGRTFDRWSEGTLNFPPTYKYEFDSEKYVGEDPKAGRRTPAWCDRILSFGQGIKLLSYKRSELKLSDHRPVTAVYCVEVEVCSPRKLKRALTFTDAEIENEGILDDKGLAATTSQLRPGEDMAYWER